MAGIPGTGSGVTVGSVPEEFDARAMTDRFRARANAVKSRGIPPIEGPERRRFVEQAQLDYMDFAMLADADITLDEGVLTLRIDLRPRDDTSEPQPP